MEIFEFQDTEEQTLLCLNYDFTKDWEMDREEAFKRLGRAKDTKRFWNYSMLFKGVRILVAYEGSSPVGHLEYIPIEHAPRPVTGEGLTFITCMFVPPKLRWHGVGAQLLEACEEKAREHTGGLAVIAYPDSLFMPAGFFSEYGFAVVDDKDSAWLMVKSWQDVQPPKFLPLRYQPLVVPASKTAVEIFWCGQCPFWTQARDELRHVAHELGQRVVVREINTDDREIMEQWGIANGVFIQGECAFLYPPSRDELRKALQAKLS